MNTKALQKAIDIAGGQTKLAKKVKVTQTAVSHWLTRNKRVPAERAVSIEKATGGQVTRRDLRPDLYPRE